MVKKAVIVAAGISSRLYPLTKTFPKGLLDVGGISLLQRTINILQSNNINEIAVVVGFEREKIIAHLSDQVSYISNPFYKNCNNMGSLWFAKDFIAGSEFVYLHADIIYDERIFSSSLHSFLSDSNEVELIIDFDFFDEESMKVRIDDRGCLIESNKQIDLDDANGEWIGVAFIRHSKTLFRYIDQIMFNEGLNFYDTYAFTKMAKDGHKIFCRSTKKMDWIEIDFLKDYKKAKRLFR